MSEQTNVTYTFLLMKHTWPCLPAVPDPNEINNEDPPSRVCDFPLMYYVYLLSTCADGGRQVLLCFDYDYVPSAVFRAEFKDLDLESAVECSWIVLKQDYVASVCKSYGTLMRRMGDGFVDRGKVHNATVCLCAICWRAFVVLNGLRLQA